MHGWFSSESTRASRMNRSTLSCAPHDTTLIATGWSVSRSVARNTAPMPPVPASSPTRNRSFNTSPNTSDTRRLSSATLLPLAATKQRRNSLAFRSSALRMQPGVAALDAGGGANIQDLAGGDDDGFRD